MLKFSAREVMQGTSQARDNPDCMEQMSRVMRFDGERLVSAPDPLPEGTSPAIADSFLMRDGMVRALRWHSERFREAVAAHAPALLHSLPAFTAACADELMGEFEVFPRLDVVDESFWLRIRPVPALTATATAVTERVDVVLPALKGPNISLYTQLNTSHNCETVRVNARGNVIEGVTSAVLWWQDDSLHSVASTERITSTTEHFLFSVAHDLGFSVTQASITPAQLCRHETWLVNALHGIRPLTGLDDAELPIPNGRRLAQFTDAFEASWSALV